MLTFTAQLRYKIDSSLQQQASHRQQAVAKDDSSNEYEIRDIPFENQSYHTTENLVLEIELLLREIGDLKGTIEKQALQVRAKEVIIFQCYQ